MDTSTTTEATQSRETAIGQNPAPKNAFIGSEKPYSTRNVLKDDLPGWGSTPKEEPVDPAPEKIEDEKPVEEATASTITEENKPVQESNDQVSKAFAEIARREKEMRVKEKKLQEQMDSMESRLKKYEDYESADDPLKALQARGYSYEDATRALLHKKDGDIQKSPEVIALEKKLADIESKLEKQDQTYEDKQAQEKVDSFKNTIKGHVIDSDTKYELVKTYGMEDAVFETIISTKENEGRSLTIDEACILVENELESKLKQNFDQLRNIGKTQKWFGDNPTSQETKPDNTAETPAQRAVQEVTEAQGQSQGSTSLNNKMQSPESLPIKKKLNTEESLRLAARNLKWGD